MKIYKNNLILILIVVLTLFTTLGCGNSSSNEDPIVLNEFTTLEYVREAFTFTFPLVYMHITKVRFTNAMVPTPVAAPVNQFCHSEFIADTNYGETAHVNYDVVTSQAFLDLKKDAVVLVRPVPDRFCVFELFDAYTNCVRTIGEGAESNGTKYLITGPDFKGRVPAGMIQVAVPTNIAWLVGRIRCFGEEDLDTVKEIQEEMELKTLSLYQGGFPQPDGTYFDPNEYVPLTKLKSLTSEEYFNLANELMVDNPPKDIDKDVLARMKSVGVGPGLKFNPNILGENAARYFETMKQNCMEYEWAAESQPYLFAASNHDSGKWKFYTYNIANFGTEYSYRAFCALKYFCTHPNATCLTYFTYTDEDNETLNGTYTYRLRFKHDKFPPLANENGFWSITVYDANNHIITEDENSVFSVTDLTELNKNATYTDIILEAGAIKEDDEDEENINKLPIPDNRDFHLLMRIYLPHEAAINGFWSAPIISKKKEDEE